LNASLFAYFAFFLPQFTLSIWPLCSPRFILITSVIHENEDVQLIKKASKVAAIVPVRVRGLQTYIYMLVET